MFARLSGTDSGDMSTHSNIVRYVAMAKTVGEESTWIMPRNENQQCLNDYNS